MRLDTQAIDRYLQQGNDLYALLLSMDRHYGNIMEAGTKDAPLLDMKDSVVPIFIPERKPVIQINKNAIISLDTMPDEKLHASIDQVIALADRGHDLDVRIEYSTSVDLIFYYKSRAEGEELKAGMKGCLNDEYGKAYSGRAYYETTTGAKEALDFLRMDSLLALNVALEDMLERGVIARNPLNFVFKDQDDVFEKTAGSKDNDFSRMYFDQKSFEFSLVPHGHPLLRVSVSDGQEPIDFGHMIVYAAYSHTCRDIMELEDYLVGIGNMSGIRDTSIKSTRWFDVSMGFQYRR